MSTLFTLTYQLATPFTGSPNTVTNVVPNVVGIYPNSSSRQPPYVIPDPNNPPTGVLVKGAVQLNIVINDGTSNQFYPLGLAVQNPSVRTRVNPAIFPMATVSGSTPTIISLVDNAQADTVTSYEFVVLFQDNNGYFGTLDPKIANTDT